MTIKFMYNGIKEGKKLHKAHYSNGKLTNYPDGTITIYARDYKDLPKIEGLEIHNNSDSMTDYFDNDKIRVTPDSKYYNEVYQAWEKQEIKRAEVIRKRNEKRLNR